MPGVDVGAGFVESEYLKETLATFHVRREKRGERVSEWLQPE